MKRLIVLFVLLFAITMLAQAAPTYYYVVTTVDTAGFESVNSNQGTAAFTQGQHTATASWAAVAPSMGGAPVAGYNVYRSQTPGGPYTKINTALVTAVTYVDPFVPPNAPSITVTTGP